MIQILINKLEQWLKEPRITKIDYKLEQWLKEYLKEPRIRRVGYRRSAAKILIKDATWVGDLCDYSKEQFQKDLNKDKEL